MSAALHLVMALVIYASGATALALSASTLITRRHRIVAALLSQPMVRHDKA